MTDETTALLIRARGFLERGWCKRVFSANAEGIEVGACSPDAVAWCMAGALLAAQETPGGDEVEAHGRLADAIGGDRLIASFNDAQETVEPVLAAFDLP